MRFTKLMMGVLVVAPALVAANEPDAAKEEMQRALNSEVMSTPFNPGDAKKAQLYAEESKRRNVLPVAHPPSYWLPGWTCTTLTAYRYYSYAAYRDCVYYHHYYGRYWR
jgi:hypothetical protein